MNIKPIQTIAMLAVSALLAACSSTEPTATPVAPPSAAAADSADALGAPERSRSIQEVIFYGFNKSAITAEADAVLHESAMHIRERAPTSIELVGHADTAESEPDVLSKVRADAVVRRLEELGVTVEIQARGAGAKELMIQTGPGVKEPQNRRVTIGY